MVEAPSTLAPRVGIRIEAMIELRIWVEARVKTPK